MCEHINVDKANLLDVVVLDVQSSNNLLILDNLAVRADTFLRNEHFWEVKSGISEQRIREHSLLNNTYLCYCVLLYVKQGF